MKRNKYNLIEIALAIGILAIGAAAIVALFPLGFQETRNSIGENYSAEAADNMLAYIAREAYSDWNSLFDGDGDGEGTSSLIPSSKPFVAPDSTMDASTWGSAVEGDIYDPGTTNDGVYGLKVISSDDNSIADFTGEVLLWKSKVKNIRVSGEDINELDYDKAVALHLEISWPVEKPYAQRKENTYYFELFNYNQ